MKKQILITLLFVVGTCNAAIDWDIYTDTTIDSGTYDTVNIYDSLDVPPVQTTVTMTGGNIDYFHVYNTANFNFESGNVFLLASHNNSNVTIGAGSLPAGPDVFELYDDSKVHLYNGPISVSVQTFGDAELHVYGYSLEYDPSVTGTNSITGFWGNGESLEVLLRQPSDYDPYTQVILHEIPEPGTVLLFMFGGLLLKRNRKHFISTN